MDNQLYLPFFDPPKPESVGGESQVNGATGPSDSPEASTPSTWRDRVASPPRLMKKGWRSFWDSSGHKKAVASVVAEGLKKSATVSNLAKLLGLPTHRPEVRSSGVKTWRECPRKFLFESRLGLRLKSDYRSALQIGIDTHALLSELYLGVAPEQYDSWVAKKIRVQWDRLEPLADPNTGLLPGGRAVSEVIDNLKKDATMAMALARYLVHVYPPSNIFHSYDIVGTEVPYVVKVEGIVAPLAIEIDMLLRHKNTKALWIIDHKTTSISPLARAQVLPFEFQSLFYQWVLSLAEPSATIGGAIHNIIQKPTIRLRKNETYEDYVDKRIPEWYEEQFTLRPDDPPIIQSVVPAPNHLCTEEMLLQILEVSKASTTTPNCSKFPRRDTACMGKLGNSPCPFLRLCRSENRHTTHWQALLKEDYVSEPRPLLSDKVSTSNKETTK